MFRTWMVILLVYCTTPVVHASIISVNGSEVKPLEIDSSFSSFSDFYDYDTSKKWSTSLPYAKINTAVFLVAELNDTLALFGFFDAFSNGIYTGNGQATFDYAFKSGSGDYDLVNDPSDTVVGTTINFRWYPYYGDGFVLAFDKSDFIDLDTFVYDVAGLNRGFSFLSFDDQGVAAEIKLASGNMNIVVNTVDVPEPSIFGLALLGLFGFAFNRNGSKLHLLCRH